MDCRFFPKTAYRFVKYAWIFPAVLLVVPPAHAVTAKQVLVDTKVVETVQPVTEQLLYETVSGRDTIADIAMLIKTLPDRSTVVEASIISYGRGVDFRRIETQRPVLTAVDSGALNRIQPSDIQKIVVRKSSVAAPVAPLLFGLIGSQYEGPGAKAASTPGQVCPVTGQPLSESGQTVGRGDLARSIDKAGMAAGLGLLASQAKGDLEGIKVRWDISASIGYDSLKLSFDAFNKNSKKSEPMAFSFSYDPNAAAKAVSSIRYLPIRYNASVESGPVVTEQEFLISPQRLRQFRISVQNILRGKGEDADAWVPRGSQLEYAGADYWDDYEHEWDDFDEEGYCYDCGHYEPEADDYNYDKDGRYLGDTRTVPDKLVKILVDPVTSESYLKGALTGEKATFITDYPVTRAIFKTQAYNKRTQELLIITTPVILKDRE